MNGNHKTYWWVLLLVVFWSCQQLELDTGGKEVVDLNKVSIGLNVSSTRGEPSTIENAMILVYGDDSNVPAKRKFVSSQDDTDMLLPNGKWRFLILGNVIEEPEEVNLEEIMAYSFPMDSLKQDSPLPLSVDTTIVVNSDMNLSLQLARIVSRFDVHVDLDESLENAIIRSVQLRGVSESALFFENDAVELPKTDLALIRATNHNSLDAILYVPEQHLGFISSITTPRQKTIKNAPEGAAFLDLSLSDPASGQLYSYKLPLGSNNTSSFEIPRSSYFTINLNVEDLGAGDPREETWAINGSDNFDSGSFSDSDGKYYTAIEDGRITITTSDLELRNVPMDLVVELLSGERTAFSFNGVPGQTVYKIPNIQLQSGISYNLDYRPEFFTDSNGNLVYQVSLLSNGETVYEKIVDQEFYNQLSVYGGTSSNPMTPVGSLSVSGNCKVFHDPNGGSLIANILSQSGPLGIKVLPSSGYVASTWYDGSSIGGTMLGSGSTLSYTFSSVKSSIYHKFLPR